MLTDEREYIRQKYAEAIESARAEYLKDLQAIEAVERLLREKRDGPKETKFAHLLSAPPIWEDDLK